MRTSILVAVVAWVICPALAFAKPKVAVVPIDGDDKNKIEALVIEAASVTAKVLTTKTVAKAIKTLGIDDPDNSKAAKKLRKELEVDAVIYGKLEHDGTKKKLRLSVYTHGKKAEHFEVEYKLSSSKAFHTQLRDELANRLEPDENGKDDDDDDVAAAKPKEKLDANDDAKPKLAEDKPKHGDDDAKPTKKSKHADDDATPTRTAAADDDGSGDTASVHKHSHHHKKAEGVEAPRDYVTQSSVFVDAGVGGEHRSLTWVPTAGNTTPPRVGTGAFALQFDGEIYPGSFDTLDGIGAAIGVYFSFNRTIGLTIPVPGATQISSIAEGSYVFGARYRFVFGQSSLAVGASYWNTYFIADRSTLTSPTQLDTPDVDYKAFAPDVLLRLGFTPSIAATLQLDLPLMLSSGAITDASYYGLASVVSLAVQAGVDFALGQHYALHVSGFFDQESLTFKMGTLASATDRQMGLLGTFAVMF